MTHSNKNARLRCCRGRFMVSFEMMREPLTLLRVMRGVLVTDVRALYHQQTVEYFAVSRHFGPVAQGVEAPLYMAQIVTAGRRHRIVKVSWIHADEHPLAAFGLWKNL